MHLHTKRLLLREYDEGDDAAMLDYQSDPAYLRYSPWAERRPDDVRALLQFFLEGQQQEPRTRFQLAVTRSPGGELIGSCGIRLKSHDAHEGDLGYELAPQHWGQGYASEAARAMVEFGFTQLGLHRISSWCIADNARSARVLEGLGMALEGRLREHQYYKGRWWDTLLYGLLVQEWRGSA